MRRILFRLSILFLTIFLGIVCHAAWSYYNPPFVAGRDKPVPYRILKDDMTPFVSIGIDAGVSERGLCATLSQAADDRMDDRARDYLMSEYIWIEAHLIEDGKQSAVPAGKLRRYVPPGNPNYKEWHLLPAFLSERDWYIVSLDPAKQSLR
jgi:hypothetical protein